MIPKNSFSSYGIYKIGSIISGAEDNVNRFNSLYFVFRPGFAYEYSTENIDTSVALTTWSTNYTAATIGSEDLSSLGFNDLYLPSSNIQKYNLNETGNGDALLEVGNELWLYQQIGLANGGQPYLFRLVKVSDEDFEKLFGFSTSELNQKEKEFFQE